MVPVTEDFAATVAPSPRLRFVVTGTLVATATAPLAPAVLQVVKGVLQAKAAPLPDAVPMPRGTAMETATVARVPAARGFAVIPAGPASAMVRARSRVFLLRTAASRRVDAIKLIHPRSVVLIQRRRLAPAKVIAPKGSFAMTPSGAVPQHASVIPDTPDRVLMVGLPASPFPEVLGPENTRAAEEWGRVYIF